VTYGANVALDSINLKIQRGEAVGFVGLSGAGKTTLFRLLNGMVRPTGGTVHVNGTSLAKLSVEELRKVRAQIGFVHQDLSLIPNLRVLHNVLAGRLGRLSLLQGTRTLLFPPRSAVHAVYGILERVGIPEKIYERTDRLSGGQQQRVAIARALFQKPQGLLADEPVSSVDPARARSAVSLLTEISREEGLTLCVSLHNLHLAREFFPRLVGLRQGRIVFDRATQEIREDEFQALYDLGTASGGGDKGREE
jgi:phosphonate transport system ATP-binding protein